MALNFSHRTVLPTHISEEKLVSPMSFVNGYLMEGISEKNGEGFARPWHVNRDMEGCFDYGRDRNDRCGSPESVSKDIIDLLPSDPFGMDISTTFTAITGWLEDLEVDYGGYGWNNVGASKDDYGWFAGLNLILNKAMGYESVPNNMLVDDKSNTASHIDWCVERKELGDALDWAVSPSVQTGEDIMSLDVGSTSNSGQNFEVYPEGNGCLSDVDGGPPHEAFLLALSYLGVRDLLCVEKVCKSLHYAVRSDPLYWRNFHVGLPLNEKITDDTLLQLTSRAQGNLQCLSLVDCPRITDDGLKRVLEFNLRLTKLYVPGCTRLTIEGIVNNLKTLKSNSISQGIKHLRIGGIFGVTEEYFVELKELLGEDCNQKLNYKPHFYIRGNFYLLSDDDRAIDIERCPRCEKWRLIYDCTVEGCHAKDNQICRGCTLCIPRCIECGRCIVDNEYEETFCLELLCLDCFKQVVGHQEG